MKLEQIKNYLDNNDWFKVDEEEFYLSTEDIHFRFELGQWEEGEVIAIPNNILNFITQLEEVVDVTSTSKVNVKFYYDRIKLKSLDLYSFSGKDRDQYPNRPIKVFFAVPSTYRMTEKIQDMFCLALIKYFNDDYSQGKIKYAIKTIE